MSFLAHFYDTFVLNYDGKHSINLSTDSQQISPESDTAEANTHTLM